jgi:hypothetical protein
MTKDSNVLDLTMRGLLVYCYRTTRRTMPEDFKLEQHRYENVKSQFFKNNLFIFCRRNLPPFISYTVKSIFYNTSKRTL